MTHSNHTDINIASFLDDGKCVQTELDRIDALSNMSVINARYLTNSFISEDTGSDHIQSDGTPDISVGDPKWTFSRAWDVNFSVPLYFLIVFGLLNFKRETLFIRFNALGSITTFILGVVIIYKACIWRYSEYVNFRSRFQQDL